MRHYSINKTSDVAVMDATNQNVPLNDRPHGAFVMIKLKETFTLALLPKGLSLVSSLLYFISLHVVVLLFLRSA